MSFPPTAASFPVVLGDFRCDVTCQFAFSAVNSDSANWPGYEATPTGTVRTHNGPLSSWLDRTLLPVIAKIMVRFMAVLWVFMRTVFSLYREKPFT